MRFHRYYFAEDVLRATQVMASVIAFGVCAVALVVSSPVRADDWVPRAENYSGVHVERNIRLTMSDGARMTASLLRPALEDGSPAPGQFPVVLTQTSYTEDSDRSDYLIRRGYVQLIVFARGTGGSEGQNTFGGDREQMDGAELVAWASSQPWSDGRVAVFGQSFMGLYALLTAGQQPPALRAAFTMVTPGDTYRDIGAPGGRYNLAMNSLGVVLAPPLSLIPPGWTADEPIGAAALVASHAAAPVTYQIPNTLNFLSGDDQSYDGPSYQLRSPLYHIPNIVVPTFLFGGWYDMFQRGVPRMFEEFQSVGATPAKLVMGPWDHLSGPWAASLSSDPEWTLMMNEYSLRWFDHYVRGIPDPDLAKTPNVTFYRLGSDEYETADTWPPAGIQYKQYYLSGPATPGTPGTLGDTPPAAQNPDSIVAHPFAEPCSPTAGGGFVTVPLCDGDQRVNGASAINYDLQVDQELSITGLLAARLFVSVTALFEAEGGGDAFISPRLQVVAPDGSVGHLTAGWQLLSFRALDPERSLQTVALDGSTVYPRPHHPFTRESELPVVSGEVYEVWIEISPIAASIAPGHKLRVSFQPSDFPHAVPTLPEAPELVGSLIELHHDSTYPSAIVLPEPGRGFFLAFGSLGVVLLRGRRRSSDHSRLARG